MFNNIHQRCVWYNATPFQLINSDHFNWNASFIIVNCWQYSSKLVFCLGFFLFIYLFHFICQWKYTLQAIMYNYMILILKNYEFNTLTAQYEITFRLRSLTGPQATSFLLFTYLKTSTCCFLVSFLKTATAAKVLNK